MKPPRELARVRIVDGATVTIPLDPYLSLKALSRYSALSVRALRGYLTDPTHPCPTTGSTGSSWSGGVSSTSGSPGIGAVGDPTWTPWSMRWSGTFGTNDRPRHFPLDTARRSVRRAW